MSKKVNNILDINKLEYQTYDNDVDSDIEWLGNVPKTFNLKRLKDVVKYVQTGTTPNQKLIENQNNLTENWFTPSDFKNEILINSKRKISKYAIINNQVRKIPKNSILIVSIGATLGKLSLTTEDTYSNQQITSIIPETKINNKYLYYLLLSNSEYIKVHSNDTTIAQLNNDNLKNINNFLIAPKKEQLAIVKFLDSKTSQIDKKIELLENQNRLEEELEKSIINQCVTKGVDSFTKKDKNGNLIDFDNTNGLSKEDFDIYMNENAYKDSGIEYLRYIKKEYNLKKLKNILKFSKGKNAQIYSNEYIKNEINIGKYPVYSGQTKDNGVLGSIKTFDYNVEKILFVTTVGAKAMENKLLFGKFSLSQNCALMELKNNKNIYDYYNYLLKIVFGEERKTIPTIITPSLRIEDLEKYFVLKLLKKEQLEIVKFLDSKTSQIKTSREKRSKEIKLLKEYKKTLINDVVTGKIKVIKD